MQFLFLVFALAAANFIIQKREQRKRIILLGRQLGQFQIEKLMQTLADGYLRALGEADADRREQVWRYLETAEVQFCEQFNKFSAQMLTLDGKDTRVSKFGVGFAFATQLFPKNTFDLREVLAIHAIGIEQAAKNEMARSPRDKAFTLSAELFLMQHTCHWFCNSKDVASARMLMRHKTPYAQVLAAVDPDTRSAYCSVTGTKPPA
ncbi:MAG: hypothetical protein V4614_13660 [Pseudomonadota bacterium]